jgi:hypothetical protein
MSEALTPAGPGPRRKPLWARRRPLDLADAAQRTTAYVYGNLLVLAALVALSGDEVESGRAFWIVLGTAVSTFVAHVFAEAMGASVRNAAEPEPADPTVRDAWELARESYPILTSGFLPAVIIALGWLEILPADPALYIADAVILFRIASTGIIVARLRNEPSSLRIILLGIGVAVVAGLISLLKVYLTH